MRRCGYNPTDVEVSDIINKIHDDTGSLDLEVLYIFLLSSILSSLVPGHWFTLCPQKNISLNWQVFLYSRAYQPTVISEMNLILGISGWWIIFWSRIHFHFFNLMHPCLAISKRSQGSKEADLNHPTNRRRLLTNQKQLFSHMDLLCPTGAEQSCDWIAGLLLVNET